jgi:hypothetical protein
VVTDVLLSTIAILKGKPLLGMLGIFVPLVSFVAAIRLAAPGSWWARRRYAPDSHKLARSQKRWGRIHARRLRVANTVAGAPVVPAAVGATLRDAGATTDTDAET